MARSVWKCKGCETLYAVKLSRCTRCNGIHFEEKRSGMAKITKHGGPSDASADTVITGVEPSVPANVESEDVHAEPVETPFEPEPEPIPDAEPTGLYSFDAPSTPTTSTGRRRR